MPKQKKFSIFFGIALGTACLAYYIHKHRQGRTSSIDGWIISVTGSLQKSLTFVSHGSRSIIDHYFLLVQTQEENETLRREVAYLRMKMTALQETEVENTRLRRLLDFRENAEEKLLPAHVVAQDVAPDYVGIRIDRGSRDGVRPGLGVITAGGLVGRIYRVSEHYSDVLTLVDPTSNIDAVIQRSRARGIVSGHSKQLACKLKYIDRLEDVEANDTIVSSGFGGVFPKGLLIGYVSAVVPATSGILQTITVKPAVDVLRVEEVFVVFPPAESQKTS